MAGNNEDPAMTLMLIMAILGVMAWGVWSLFRAEFLEFIRYFRLIEIWVLGLFDDHARACATWLRVAQVTNEVPTVAAVGAAHACFGAGEIESLKSTQDKMLFYTITPASLGYIGQLVGSYTKWLLITACAGVAYYALYKSDRNKFRTTYNLESFINIQARVWPVIAPIVKFNPSKASSRILGTVVPRKIPIFAEALAPEEWLAYHNIPVVKGIPVREAVYNALVLQLGPRWTGPDDLPPYIQALLAAFALKGVQKREESDKLLGDLSLCWTDKTGFHMTPELAAEIKKILKDPAIGGKAMEVAARGAYRITSLLATLKWARFMGGVLASAQFLWLRGVDRDLWYALNNLGRRSFHSEGAGAIAHFMAEDIAQKPLIAPRLETAIATINKYLSDSGAQIPASESSAPLLVSSQKTR